MSSNFRNKTASQHDFSMVPRADIPRSRYRLAQNLKTAFNAADLVPIYCEELLPGDLFNGRTSVYARFATPIVPVLDDAMLETFYFFVPSRILWTNWEGFITGGNFTIPISTMNSGGPSVGSLFDFFGIPTVGQIAAGQFLNVNALPLRAYNKIYNDWFQDENLATAANIQLDNGPDDQAQYTLRKRAKVHDYFTSALPWPQKGTAVSLPLGSTATIKTNATATLSGAQNPITYATQAGALIGSAGTMGVGSTGIGLINNVALTSTTNIYPNNLYADLSTATSATINAIRTAFQIQRLLERDARGGTRLTETIQAHFGVRPPDYRLQRSEYIGGGSTQISTTPVAQTSGTGASGQTTPLGNLSAFTTANGANHRFKYAATEHGYIVGIANVRVGLTYQQGLRRMWKKATRNEFYWPAFAHLGEQSVFNYEIYCKADTNDPLTFGYQERYAEYRYTPNMITGIMRSTAASTIDIWHYAEKFTTLPALNQTFIESSAQTVLARSMAVGAAANGQQILFDALHTVDATRPMPTYSVPGLIDHF